VGTESAVNACAASANQGLAELVASESPELHDGIVAAIDAATTAIADIPGPYYEAVGNGNAATDAVIADAIDRVRELFDLLSGNLLTLLDDVDFRY
jgi:hypothetical protein